MIDTKRTPFIMRFLSATVRRGWLALGLFALITLAVMPLLHLALPADNPLHVSGYVITLTGKILCYAIVTVEMDLLWGYTGILSLVHCVFFALGAYAFALFLVGLFQTVTVYEDGSATVAGWAVCLPGGICNE